jgi:glycosyltransferase involved in cell wall biosynthesis
MKIAFIGQKGLPANQGGVEKHVEELSTKLASTGFNITVYSRPHYTKSNLKLYKGVRVINLPSIKTKNLDAITHTITSSIHALFQKYDVIHYQGVGPSLMSWIPKIFSPKTKIVITFHGIDRINEKWSGFAKIMLTIGEWTTCNFAHQTITVSKELKRYCKSKYNCQAHYIPNAGLIDNTPTIQKTKTAIFKKYQLEPNQYFLTVSRLAKNKGLDTLIKAYQKSKTNKKLVIAGTGYMDDNYVDTLKDLAKNNQDIIFTGQLSGQTLKTILKNAYLFVQPSESEGLSIALLEAVNSSVPVLISNIPANTETIKDLGLIFKNKSINDLLAKLKVSEKKPIMIKRNAKAIKKIADQEYNWNHIAKETGKLYKSK